MRIFVAVNRIDEIGHRQTTALLIASMVRRQYEVALVDVVDFQFQGAHERGVFQVAADLLDESKLRNAGQIAAHQIDSQNLAAMVRKPANRIRLDVTPDDLILIRTNPGRDQYRAAIHQGFIHYCCSAKLAGIRVINDPFHIPFFASKSVLTIVEPAYRPAMMVGEDRQQIIEFIRQSPTDCIVKPLIGSRGQDVIRVSQNEPRLAEILASTYGEKSITVQHFVSSGETGDERVIVLDGKVLEIGGHVAGIHRKPADGDFRANLHAGGTAHRLKLTLEQRKTAEFAAELLNSNGIRLAGVDLIGDKIIEFNVFSTGGLFDCQQFTGLDFSDKIVTTLLAEGPS